MRHRPILKPSWHNLPLLLFRQPMPMSRDDAASSQHAGGRLAECRGHSRQQAGADAIFRLRRRRRNRLDTRRERQRKIDIIAADRRIVAAGRRAAGCRRAGSRLPTKISRSIRNVVGSSARFLGEDGWRDAAAREKALKRWTLCRLPSCRSACSPPAAQTRQAWRG